MHRATLQLQMSVFQHKNKLEFWYMSSGQLIQSMAVSTPKIMILVADP